MIYFITGNKHKYIEAKKILHEIEMKHIPYPLKILKVHR